MHDLIVIGGGASGLAAASYALDKQLDALLVYESLGGKYSQQFTVRAEENVLVGHIMVHLELPEADAPARLGGGTVDALRAQVAGGSGAALRDRVIAVRPDGGDFVVETERGGALRAAAVIVATGVAPQPLQVSGAAQHLNHGLGYSPTTYARLLAGKTAAVIGSTPRALRGAAELARTAAKVYLLEPAALPAGDPLAAMLREQPNVEVIEGCAVTEVDGDTAVESLAVAQAGAIRRLSVDAAFVDLGLVPNSAAVADLGVTDAAGFITVDRRGVTRVPGLFAAGDVTTDLAEHVLVAVGEGVRAAIAAHDYILARGRRAKVA